MQGWERKVESEGGAMEVESGAAAGKEDSMMDGRSRTRGR